MNYYITRCATGMYEQKYIEFLLEHYKELNLPYSFPVGLSFISSPVLLKGEIFLAFNDDYEVIGALGYIHGTGENEYEDKEIVQIQAVYIVEEYRNTLLFIKGLQHIIQHIALTKQAVKEFRFWTAADDGMRRLCAKIADRRGTKDGRIDEYVAPYSAWKKYASKFRDAEAGRLK